MNEKIQRYILSIPGEVATNYFIKVEKTMHRRPNPYAEKEIIKLEDVLQTILRIAMDKTTICSLFNLECKEFLNAFLEEKINNAYYIINLYFELFNTESICKKDWDLFLLIFNIESPGTKAQYNLELLDDKYKDVGMNSFLKLCINKNGINEKELKKVANIFLNEKNELINISFDYVCYSTRDMLVAIINYIFNNKNYKIIKICENCRKVFIPKKTDAKYCDRTSPQNKNKTCKQIMDLAKKSEALNDPIKRLYKNIYNTLYSSYSHSENENNKKVFETFVKDNKIKDSEYKKGILSTKDYENWLKSFYKRK